MSIVQQGMELGRPLDEATVKTGLQEMNPDLHFDLAAAIGQIHPFINDRQGVYLYGSHICAMDRGMIPEYKIWTQRTIRVEGQWAEADLNTASIQWRVVRRGEEGFEDKKILATTGSDPSLMVRDDGAVVEMVPIVERKVKGRVHRLGWRHTFEALLRHQVRGVTRQSLSERFGVDMLKYPVGPPDEVSAALLEE
jgi:hypothetical protein